MIGQWLHVACWPIATYCSASEFGHFWGIAEIWGKAEISGGLEPEAFAALRSLLDVIEACKVSGEPRDVFAMIEEDLRAWIGCADLGPYRKPHQKRQVSRIDLTHEFQ